MTDTTIAPILSTPSEHIFADTAAIPTPVSSTASSKLTEEQLYVQYEIKRTIAEIREGQWKRIALQFPDHMLVDAPRVFERLRDGLRAERQRLRRNALERRQPVEDFSAKVEKVDLGEQVKQVEADSVDDVDERLCILADTSYGACCVDEIAAQHVDADVVVHYGRSCLSPTARLPVIYVFTSPPLDLEAAIHTFKQTYADLSERVCLMADIPYNHHIPTIYERLKAEGYSNIFATEVLHSPSSLLPNRTIPPEAQSDPEALKIYSILHISTPPTSLLLMLSSRVKRIHILPTSDSPPSGPLPEATTTPLLRRRYANLLRISSTPIVGILINTLSVSNYAAAIQRTQELIRQSGKKSYLFVVGKVNAAKMANFSEVGVWVVIGCWESSLLENGGDFFAPVMTPFELEVALNGDAGRVWGGEWVGGFDSVLWEAQAEVEMEGESEANSEAKWDEQSSDDEPPDFDLRTGRYISHSRPMGRIKPRSTSADRADNAPTNAAPAPPSSALVQRAKGDLATINGTISPGAEFLRSTRTWQGLGSDYEIAYERDDEGKIRGAAMEEGRSGVARGYAVGADTARS